VRKVYIRKVSEVKEEEVDMEGSKDTTIQWLITKEIFGAENFAMRRFRIKPGGEIPKHHHHWEHELYVLEGKGIIGVDDKEYEISKNMFAYVPPDHIHWYKNPYNEDFVFLCIIPYKEREV